MPAKIRLQRRGKKGQAFYHIVIADGRAPRDGRFIERIGTYNPITKPADIKLDFEKALNWLQNGAQPTDTVRAILSYKGILYKHHLLKGVKKGALTEEQAEAKFQAWMTEKQAKIDQVNKDLDLAKKEDKKARLDAEKKVNEAIAAKVAEKRAEAIEEEVVEAQEEAVEAAAEEAPAAEAATEEAPAAEEAPATEEAPAEDKAE